MMAALFRWIKKNKPWLYALSVVVVFCMTYVLILPALTLEQDQAAQQGGIDLPATEQSLDALDEGLPEDPQGADVEKPDADSDKNADTSGDRSETEKAGESSPDPAVDGLAFEGEGFSITAKAGSSAKLPEDTMLTAAEVTPDAEDYDAWYEMAEKALKDSPLVKDDVTLKSAKFYDITLQAEGEEVQPADDVNVKISYDKSLKMSKSGDVHIVHFGLEKNGEIEAEVLKDSAVEVKTKNSAKAGTVEVSDISFDAPGFSMYGVLETTTLEETVVTADGKNYKVTVTYDADAKVPEGAKLAVSEIESNSDAYKDYVSKSEEALGMDEGTAGYVRLFDIKILDKDGNKVDIAAPVDVKIELADKEKNEKTKVVHFADGSNRGDVVKDVAVDGQTINFDADGFSVYAVVGGSTDDNARMILKFYSKGNEVATMYVKNGDTAAELETILYDPGIGTLAEGETFAGWILDKPDYTTADLSDIKTIDDVRTWAESLEITEGDTHRLDAAICKLYTITYKDDDGTVLGMDAVPVKSGEEGTAVVTRAVKMAYTPKDDIHNFEGWKLDSTSDAKVTSVIPDDRIYQNDTPISIKGDISFTVNAPPGHWLVFNENGKGGKYNAPQFVKEGETTQQPCDDSEMVRNGYTFGGWYTRVTGAPDSHGYRTVDETSGFTFGGQLTDRTELYAKWIPKTTAPYTVIFWTQNVNRTGYDLKASTVIENGTVNQNIPYTFRDNGAEDYVRVGGTDYHYTGFCMQQPTQQVKITPEGDAVLNLYFDRIEYDLRFYLYRYNNQPGDNDYEYARDSASGNNVWGVVNYHERTTLANMPTVDAPFRIQSSSVDGFTSYYFVLHAYYGQDISQMWPKYSQIHCPANNREAVSYVMMVGTKLKPRPSSSGDGTVKGLITRLDENILGATNSVDGNFLIVRFNAYNNWTYHLYYEAYEGQDLTGKITKELNGKTYYHDHTANDITSRSSNTEPYSQNPPQYQGFETVKWTSGQYQGRAYYDGVDSSIPVGSGGNYTGYSPTLNYYYDRLAYPINYKDGTYFDGDGNIIQNRQEELLHTSDDIDYEAPIPQVYKDYIPDLPEGENGYVFDGWYADAACNTPYDFTTMPIGGIVVYAKWIQEQYRVFLHSNADRDPNLSWGSDSVQTSFRVNYGGKVSTPRGTREGSGYEFVGWYTDPSLSAGSLYNSDTILNDETVTTPYDQTESTERDKWGDPISTVNKDAQENRFWITKKLELYAKWRKILEGEGINVVYTADDGKGHVGSNPPEDTFAYPDQAEAIAQGASKAPDDMYFKNWVVQKWDEASGMYVDTDLTLVPGDNFTVKEEYARKQAIQGESGKYTYTMQLRAEYGESGSRIPTHIWWFDNFPDSGPGRQNSSRQDEGIHINEAVNIKGAPTREGYIFLGWARVPTGTSQSAAGTPPTGEVLNLSEDDIYLKYENGTFKLNDSTSTYNGSEVSQVAADERLEYHDMYGVWVKAYTVTVKKVVESEIDTDKTIDFSFTETQEIQGVSGTDSFTLKHDQEKSYVKIFPAGSKFSATETVNSDFDITVEGKYKDDQGQEHAYTNITNGSNITIQGDTVITFKNTRKHVPIKIKKVDDNNQPLTGATFQLQIKNENNVYVNNGDPFVIDAEGAIYTINLPSGDYKLIETEAPAGYIIKSLGEEFHVNAAASTDVITLVDYTDASLDPSDTTGKTMIIKNHPGEALPSTGGPGTFIFYIFGGLMIVGCGVLLIRRRRIRGGHA